MKTQTEIDTKRAELESQIERESVSYSNFLSRIFAMGVIVFLLSAAGLLIISVQEAFGIAMALAVIAITAWAVSLAVLSHIIAEAAHKLINEKLDGLTEEKKLLDYLSPDRHAKNCLQYADWVESGEKAAVEFHSQLGGRRPTLGEFKDLAGRIARKNGPPTEQERAKEACEKMFGGSVSEGLSR